MSHNHATTIDSVHNQHQRKGQILRKVTKHGSKWAPFTCILQPHSKLKLMRRASHLAGKVGNKNHHSKCMIYHPEQVTFHIKQDKVLANFNFLQSNLTIPNQHSMIERNNLKFLIGWCNFSSCKMTIKERMNSK